MAELSELFSDLLNGAVDAIARSEAEHLKVDVDAAISLAGKDLSQGIPAEILGGLLDKGYIPDIFAGDEVEIEANLATSMARERKMTAGGGVTWGPVKIDASLSDTRAEQTNTNLTVRCKLRRVSKSTAMDKMVENLQQLSGVPANPPPVAPPAVIKP